MSESLNAALYKALADDPRRYLIGEDLADPYGGAFKVTRGLSTAFPGQVLSTPISEAAIVGLANGLALAGSSAIVEIMFADFATLAFDQLVNFAAKSVTMYGHRVPMPLLVRCPTGGNRGYGPTHSQSPQKHFLGVPSLDVYELTPFHDTTDLVAGMLATGRPGLLFEDKVLYTERMFTGDDLLRHDLVGDWPGWARTTVVGPGDDYAVLAPGGLSSRALAAMRSALLTHELSGALLTPARLYPLDLAPVLATVAAARRVLVVEDGPPGAGWATEVAFQLQTALWGRLRRPVRVLQAADAVVPAARHLERSVLVQAPAIAAELLREDA
ncbi:transketolase C-terminal domain-containing protein [Dactylosporangium sp. NPDC049742]|uniref:alpha-ketoacid dehydrogenase subunit beta n=1 Tax=Dactylosporangium sp. NPDC049742 TaxID=3154737 RepID=UPI0034281974